MIKLSDIFRKYGEAYLNKYSYNMLPSHKKAIWDISFCRTPVMGGQVYQCPDCNQYHYSYHSCGNRNCNACQNDKTESWLESKKELLISANYFMVTFTIPDSSLGSFVRENQKLFYNILFKSSAQSIDALSSNPKYIGGKPGYIGILHTWSRKLAYHPHIHYIVTGGGFSFSKDKWVDSNSKFLLPVKALSTVFKAKFRDELRRVNPKIFSKIPSKTWNANWVVNSISVGNGVHATEYLAQYLFRVAISNNRIIKLDNGVVSFKYKDSKTKLWKIMKLNSEEFIRRFLQHVLPKGFVKVRYFGLFAVKNRALLISVNKSMNSPSESQTRQRTTLNETAKVICCPKCGSQMQPVLTIRRISAYNKSPPFNSFSFVIYYIKQLSINCEFNSL